MTLNKAITRVFSISVVIQPEMYIKATIIYHHLLIGVHKPLIIKHSSRSKCLSTLSFFGFSSQILQVCFISKCVWYNLRIVYYVYQSGVQCHYNNLVL